MDRNGTTKREILQAANAEVEELSRELKEEPAPARNESSAAGLMVFGRRRGEAGKSSRALEIAALVAFGVFLVVMGMLLVAQLKR